MNKQLRSTQWFGRTGKDGFIYRAWMKNQGIPDYEFNNKPVIGICNTWSELTPCNAHFRELAESVKRGISEAGGFPVEFPVMSLGETLIKPTAMLYRNLASMDVEEDNTEITDMDDLNKIRKKKKVLTNEDIKKASKGLKFNNPSQRNHSSIYE